MNSRDKYRCVANHRIHSKYLLRVLRRPPFWILKTADLTHNLTHGSLTHDSWLIWLIKQEPSNFTVKWISDKNLQTQSCKLSYCLGVYPICTRNVQGILERYHVFTLHTPQFNLWHLVSLLWWFRTYMPQTVPFNWYITCGFSIYCNHFRKIKFFSGA